MNRLKQVVVVGLLVVAALSGCSVLDSINPFSSEIKIKPAELKTITPTAVLQLNWYANIGKSGDYVLTPAVVGDSVYAVGFDGALARYDNGQQVWSVSVGQVVSGGVGSDGKLVVVGTPKGEVLAFDAANGRPLWKSRASSEILAAPAFGGGLVVVRSGDSNIFGLDPANGKRRWVYQRTTPALTLRTNVGVVMTERAVLAGFPGGKLVAIAANNGSVLWESAVAMPKGATELERVADISSSPVVDGREVCAVAYRGRVSCFDLVNGNMHWSRDLSSNAGIDLDSRNVYVSDEKGAVHALDRSNGSSLWKQDALSLRKLSRPVRLGRFIAVADYQGVVHLLHREDGAFAARLTTDGSAITAEPQRLGTDGKSFVVQTGNGGIYSLTVR